MTVRGKPGKPKAGFPPFPPPRLLLLYKETTNQVRQKPPHLRINNLEVGQNKLPKWAEYSCQTQLSNPHFRPDLIILDLNVPKISGTALLERWKSYRTPVVVFSSSMNPAA